MIPEAKGKEEKSSKANMEKIGKVERSTMGELNKRGPGECVVYCQIFMQTCMVGHGPGPGPRTMTTTV